MMVKTLMMLMTAVLCQNQTISNEVTNTYNKIKNFFDTKQFDQILALMSAQGQAAINPNFVANMSSLYDKTGPIVYNLLFQIGKTTDYDQVNGYIVAFNNSLILGQLTWVVQNGSIMGIYLGLQPNERSSLDLFNDPTLKASLAIFFNDQDTLEINKNQQQLIGQLISIPIALEFARQVNNNTINPATMVNIDDIKKFYIPKFDYGFRSTLDSGAQTGYILKNQISLQNIAIAMSNYASPALAEYLQTLLGLSNIDNMTSTIGLKQNCSLYAASFALAFTNYKGLTVKTYASSISSMTSKILTQAQLAIHKTLVGGKADAQAILKNSSAFLKTPAVLNVINNWSVKDTAYQYATIFTQLNNNTLIDQTIVDLFNEILNPVQQRASFEKIIFSQNSGVAYLSQGLMTLIRSAQLKFPVNGTSEITFALFVQGLTWDQIKQYSNQIYLLDLLMITNPQFCQDYVSRIKR